MRVGLFGGTFNPPHAGHRIVAEQAVEVLHLDLLIWMPARRSPFKNGNHDVDARHRLAMTRLATADHPSFVVSDLEIERPPPSYTVETVRLLAERYTEAKLFLVIGQDSWDGFSDWRRPAEIRELCTVAVYPRPTTEKAVPEGLQGTDVLWINAPRMDISSSDIRNRLKTGQAVAGLLGPHVRQYIAENSLYTALPEARPSR
ncbi:MAG: nicotinate-nucleotide adenylyltransferase [Rhodothermales bacterium]|jgi:nicotinate-nucleotide adenylyltransferase